MGLPHQDSKRRVKREMRRQALVQRRKQVVDVPLVDKSEFSTKQPPRAVRSVSLTSASSRSIAACRRCRRTPSQLSEKERQRQVKLHL